MQYPWPYPYPHQQHPPPPIHQAPPQALPTIIPHFPPANLPPQHSWPPTFPQHPQAFPSSPPTAPTLPVAYNFTNHAGISRYCPPTPTSTALTHHLLGPSPGRLATATHRCPSSQDRGVSRPIQCSNYTATILCFSGCCPTRQDRGDFRFFEPGDCSACHSHTTHLTATSFSTSYSCASIAGHPTPNHRGSYPATAHFPTSHRHPCSSTQTTST